MRRCLTVATVFGWVIFSLPASAQDEAQPRAEPVEPVSRWFVSDKLVLNVYTDADQNSARVATIETGDAVDELGRAENFVHVARRIRKKYGGLKIY